MSLKFKHVLLHLAFWLLYLLVQGLVFMHFYEMENVTVSLESGKEVVTRTVFPENFYQALKAEMLDLPGKILAVYGNLLVLMPVFLFRKKIGAYAGFLALLLIGAATIQYLLARHLLIPLVFPQMDGMGVFFSGTRVLRYLATCLPLIVFTGSIQLLIHYFSEKNRSEELQKRQTVSELEYLKSQLHPHFLFNTLNNLYGLALDRSDKMPGLLLKLSGIMSYLLHDARAPELPLRRELEMLQDFIDLEKLRYGDAVEVSFRTQGNPDDWNLPPLLLLPFVENAFKHGGNDNGPLRIDTTLLIEDHRLEFGLKNTRSQIISSNRKPSGIGLENLRRRLALYFPDQHVLQVSSTPDSFFIQLKINRS